MTLRNDVEPPPTLSVVMPVYNSAPYLHAAVTAVLSQTFDDFELLLIDDGSTDASPGICDEFAGRDARAVVIHGAHRGVARTVATGISRARGAFVVLLDSDDTARPQMFEKMLQASLDFDADVIQCAFAFHGRSGQDEIHCQPESVVVVEKEDVVLTLVPNLLTHWRNAIPALVPSRCNKIIRRTILVSALEGAAMNVEIGEDLDLVLGALLCASRVVLIPDVLYDYHARPASLTWGGAGSMQETSALLESIEKRLADNHISLPAELDALSGYMIYHALVRLGASRESLRDIHCRAREILRRPRVRPVLTARCDELRTRQAGVVALFVRVGAPSLAPLAISLLSRAKASARRLTAR